MVICLTGATVKPGMEEAEEQLSKALNADLHSAAGFISAKEYTADDGEVITLIRFESDEELIRWRDEGLHGVTRSRVADIYESFWIQTGTIHREYAWLRGQRIEGDVSWLWPSGE